LDHSERAERPYHHGDLRRAILDAAERRLIAEGAEAVTIRACARDAGVSPAAPIHHFGSLKGLLGALAARGFERLVTRLDSVAEVQDGAASGTALVGAYVAFAVSDPKMFDLMWRDDLMNPDDAVLSHARRVALSRLRDLSQGSREPGDARRRAIRNWSLAHGLATLLLHGRIVKALGDPDSGLATADDFVALAFDLDFSGG
jgi:AcrR family transcriptional regulator